MVPIKSFLTGVLHGCFKLIYQYLNEGDKVRECYSCLKLMVHGYLHIAISYCFWLHVHDLSDSNYIWNCCNQAQFLNKTIVMKCLAIKLFTTRNSKNIIATLPIVALEKSELTFLLILNFHVFKGLSVVSDLRVRLESLLNIITNTNVNIITLNSY